MDKLNTEPRFTRYWKQKSTLFGRFGIFKHLKIKHTQHCRRKAGAFSCKSKHAYPLHTQHFRCCQTSVCERNQRTYCKDHEVRSSTGNYYQKCCRCFSIQWSHPSPNYFNDTTESRMDVNHQKKSQSVNRLQHWRMMTPETDSAVYVLWASSESRDDCKGSWNFSL